MTNPQDIHEHLASLERIFRDTSAPPDASDMLREFLDASGVSWHPEDDGSRGRDFVAAPSTRIVALGGIPIIECRDSLALAMSPDAPLDVAAYRSATQTMMSYSGMMSYLNSGRKSSEEMFELLLSRGELSVAHTVSASILVSGISVAVENEFNGQRDLVHMSRVTVARSAVQNDPPLVVHDPRHLPSFQAALTLARDLRRQTDTSGKDDLEAVNLLYPAAKATAFVMTGSLRNLLKLLQQESDEGKEREYRSALSQIRSNLKFVWPSLF
ncbi:hypothetical protein D3C71_197610 [compost metagenome]